MTARVGEGSPDRVARGLPTGGQGSKVYVLCAEPKEHKHFRPGTRPGGSGTRPGGSGTRGDQETVYVPNVYVPFLAPSSCLHQKFAQIPSACFVFILGKRGDHVYKCRPFQNHYTHEIAIFELFRGLQLQLSGLFRINWHYSYSFLLFSASPFTMHLVCTLLNKFVIFAVFVKSPSFWQGTKALTAAIVL